MDRFQLLGDLSNRPPVSVDQWMDFVIGSGAHRSKNTGQQKFGEILLQRYFVTLPDRYKNDVIATRYFDEMLCVVSSAMRGFSIVRDLFQTNADSLKSGKEAQMKQVEQLNRFSPMSKEGIWGKLGAVVIAVGSYAPISKYMKTTFNQGTLVSVLAVLACAVITFVVLEVLVELIRSHRMNRIERQFPVDVLEEWEKKSLHSYKKVLRQFMPLAIDVTNRYYPGTEPLFDESTADSLIDRHFAFKPRTLPQNE